MGGPPTKIVVVLGEVDVFKVRLGSVGRMLQHSIASFEAV